MFELSENTEEDELNADITQMLDHNCIAAGDRDDLRRFLLKLLTRNDQYDTMVALFISLYVAKETLDWRTYLTEANLNIFVNDSIIIMCSEAQFLTQQPWCLSGGDPYDIFGNLLAFLSEQFIAIFAP